MAWNMFLLERWKNSDYFILSIKASGWRAYFQTLLKMEHIGKGWGAHLVFIHTYVYIMFYWKKHFSTYLFRFLVYRLNLLLFRVTLSVHSKACKVHLKITTVRCYCSIIWIWHFETNLESIHVHNIFEANFVIFWWNFLFFWRTTWGQNKVAYCFYFIAKWNLFEIEINWSNRTMHDFKGSVEW